MTATFENGTNGQGTSAAVLKTTTAVFTDAKGRPVIGLADIVARVVEMLPLSGKKIRPERILPTSNWNLVRIWANPQPLGFSNWHPVPFWAGLRTSFIDIADIPISFLKKRERIQLM